jgi:hypothetical protein
MPDETPPNPATNPLAALLSGGMSNPYILLTAVLLGSGTVTFGVQQTTGPEPVATQAEVVALAEKVDALANAVSALGGAVDAHHGGDNED